MNGISLPENIYTIEVAIKGVKWQTYKMSSSIIRNEYSLFYCAIIHLLLIYRKNQVFSKKRQQLIATVFFYSYRTSIFVLISFLSINIHKTEFVNSAMKNAHHATLRFPVLDNI